MLILAQLTTADLFPPSGRSNALHQAKKQATSKKVHLVKIIGHYLGANGKFGSIRRRPSQGSSSSSSASDSASAPYQETLPTEHKLGSNLHIQVETKDIDTTNKPSLYELSVPPISETIKKSTTTDLSQVSFIKSNQTNEQAEEETETDDEADTTEELMKMQQLKAVVSTVTDHGLREMSRLFDVLEPELFHKGIYLEKGSPGQYLAAFNDQSQDLKKLARYGYAALKASQKLKEELSSSHARQEVFNITSKNTNKFPQISLLDTSLHEECPTRFQPRCPGWAHLFRTADGSCNNREKPWWGATFQPLKRYLHPSYHDGLEEVRRSQQGRLLPSPRVVSGMVHWDRDASSSSVTHLVMQWGQFIDHDLTSSSQSRGFNGSVPRCCDTPPQNLHPECLPIEVPDNDPFYSRHGIRCLEFLRSFPMSRADCALGPREQINQVTSYLDGSMIYGSTDRDANELRLFRNGMLKYTRMPQRLPLLPSDPRRGEFCRNPNSNFGCFTTGDLRVTEQPGLIAIHVVFLRLHNRLTRELAHLNQHWTDERLYQETRKIIGAILQHITYREFLPVVLGQDVLQMFDIALLKQGYYMGYDSRTSATAANSFSTAAFRFGHSMVQGRYQRWDSQRQSLFSNVSLHNELQDQSTMHRFGAVDSLMMGMCGQPAQRRDQHLTEELTNHLFETPRFPAGLDLAAINIQRGRDHGLPSYNKWRNPCGLRRMTKWEDLDNVMPQDAVRQLKRTYWDFDDIDLYTGGLSEHPVHGGLVGSTFACIIAQFFRHLRRGDRFWYENGDLPSSFTAPQLQRLRRITLARILCDNLDLNDSIQPFAFLMVDNLRNQRVSCRSNEIPFIDLKPWKENFNGKWNVKTNATAEEMLPLEVPVVTSGSSAATSFEIPRPIQIDQDLTD